MAAAAPAAAAAAPSTMRRRGCPLLLLAKLLLQVVLSAASGLPRDALKVQLQPATLHDLVEEEARNVTLKLSIDSDYLQKGDERVWKLDAKSMHPGVATVSLAEDANTTLPYIGTGPFNVSSMHYDNASRFYTAESVLHVKGAFLGKTAVQIRLVRADDWLEEDEWVEDYGAMKKPTDATLLDVWVKRGGHSERLTKYFVISLMVLIPIANILMGCELDVSVVAATLRRPTAPLIGLVTQFVVMPLLAYCIARSIFVPHGEYSLALGLFVTGCAPGGGASNFWTVLLDGNVNLSVTMTFLSTLASLVMMPLWLYLLGHEFLVGFGGSTSRLRVPYSKIGSSLATLVVPLLIGVAIARWRPTLAAKARKIMRPFIVFVLIFVVVFGALSNLYMFRMLSVRALIGGLLLPWCGFMCGCFASIVTRRSPGDVTAIAIETGIQNTGIAILLLKFSFPAPDSDISSLLPVVVACFTPGPLLLGYAVHAAMKYLQKRQSERVAGVDKCSPRELGTLNGAISLSLPPPDRPCTGLVLVDGSIAASAIEAGSVPPLPI